LHSVRFASDRHHRSPDSRTRPRQGFAEASPWMGKQNICRTQRYSYMPWEFWAL
jgi:hypothetical protein